MKASLEFCFLEWEAGCSLARVDPVTGEGCGGELRWEVVVAKTPCSAQLTLGSPTLRPQAPTSSCSSGLSSGPRATLTPRWGLLNSETHPAAGTSRFLGLTYPGCRCQAAVFCVWSAALRRLTSVTEFCRRVLGAPRGYVGYVGLEAGV